MIIPFIFERLNPLFVVTKSEICRSDSADDTWTFDITFCTDNQDHFTVFTQIYRWTDTKHWNKS